MAHDNRPSESWQCPACRLFFARPVGTTYVPHDCKPTISIHVSYHFDASRVSGYGDCCFENLDVNMSSPRDVIVLRNLLRDKLTKNGYFNPTVVIIAWNVL